jgi:hypothetical protein
MGGMGERYNPWDQEKGEAGVGTWHCLALCPTSHRIPKMHLDSTLHGFPF